MQAASWPAVLGAVLARTLEGADAVAFNGFTDPAQTTWRYDVTLATHNAFGHPSMGGAERGYQLEATLLEVPATGAPALAVTLFVPDWGGHAGRLALSYRVWPLVVLLGGL